MTMTKSEKYIQGSLYVLSEMSELDGMMDYSVQSVRLIDDMIEKYFAEKDPMSSVILGERTQMMVIAFGAYIGEVIIRNTNGTEWIYQADENFSILNTELRSTNGFQMWPLGKVARRIRDGVGDELYVYVDFAVNELINKDSASDS